MESKSFMESKSVKSGIEVTDESRRRFLSFFSGAGLGGTLLPGVLWAQAQQDGAQAITQAMLGDALALSGLTFTNLYRRRSESHAAGSESKSDPVRRCSEGPYSE
jgi:hypothetical protein